MTDNNRRIYIQLCLAQLFWAGAFVAGQLALQDQSPVFTALLRNALVTFGFWAVLFFKRDELRLPSKKCAMHLFWMGFFGIFLYTVFVYCGLKQTTAVSASLLIPTVQPLFTVLLSKLFSREPFKTAHVIGLALGFIGALGVLSGAWSIQPSEHRMIGNLLLLGGAFLFSIYSILGKSVLKELSPLATVTYSTTIGTLLLLPFPFLLSGSFDFQGMDLKFLVSLGYMVIFAGVLPYLWWYSGVKAIGVSKTGAITFLLPPFALILAVIVLGQQVSILQILGGLIGLIGVAFATGFAEQVRKIFKSRVNLNKAEGVV